MYLDFASITQIHRHIGAANLAVASQDFGWRLNCLLNEQLAAETICKSRT